MKPTHRLGFLNKATEERGTIGAAWLNPGGSITIVLSPCVTISQNKDIVLTLFPADYEPGKDRKNRKP